MICREANLKLTHRCCWGIIVVVLNSALSLHCQNLCLFEFGNHHRLEGCVFGFQIFVITRIRLAMGFPGEGTPEEGTLQSQRSWVVHVVRCRICCCCFGKRCVDIKDRSLGLDPSALNIGTAPYGALPLCGAPLPSAFGPSSLKL